MIVMICDDLIKNHDNHKNHDDLRSLVIFNLQLVTKCIRRRA
jgi:hypothetical protein